MAKKTVVPKGYSTVTTYLNVKGAKDVLSFMQKTLGAKVPEKHMNDDGSVMHAEAIIGDTRIMLGEARMAARTSSMLYMYVADCDALYKKAIRSGAKSVRLPADMDHGDRVGAVKDRAGNQWWFATRRKSLSAAQMKKALKNK